MIFRRKLAAGMFLALLASCTDTTAPPPQKVEPLPTIGTSGHAQSQTLAKQVFGAVLLRR